MKRFIGYISVLMVLSLLLLGCSATSGTEKRMSVVTTIFPLYDFTREVVGDDGDIELTCLIDNRVDMHSYSPSSQDILAIAECDVFIYVGGESDEWVADVLAQHPNERRVVINCFDELQGSLIAEDDPDEDEYDEHVWLSLRNAVQMVAAIAETIQTVDPAHADGYRANADAYIAQLEALDARYEHELAGLNRTLLIADRFPFAYLAYDYDLECFAAFSGCSAESEVTFQVVVELADVLVEHGLTHVYVIDGNDPKIAQSIISQAGADGVEILSLNSMQAVTKADIDAGATYLSLMEENLEALKEGMAA